LEVTVVADLRRDSVLDHVQSTNSTLEVTSDVVDILKSASIPLGSFHALIWSHHHVCHAGDVSLFPQDIPLVVGRGFKSNSKTHPGYPQNPTAHTLQDAFEGRKLVELDFNDDHAVHAKAKNSNIIICGLRAVDWFGDDSFYLLEAPGHSSEHIMGLARTAEDKFILLGGDAAHHAGEFRPSASLPLPESVVPSPFGPPDSRSSYPGSAFESVHPATTVAAAAAADTAAGAFRITPFYTVAPFMQTDPVAYRTTLEAVKTLDASPDVFVTFAHDSALCDVLEFYPKGELTEWYKDGPGETSKKEIGRWRFLKDFQVTDPAP
jgi:glyoxylase-like metal-dependent hydrolase (beta-lactamase superfamily II)